jgi:Flp pilus assembly protein protease CpaA
MPDLDPNRKLRNWLVLVLLAAFAVLLYVSVMVKFASHGH